MCNSCFCHKTRFIQRVVVCTNQLFARTNPCLLIRGAQRNIEQKTLYSSNHPQKDTLGFGKNIVKNPLIYNFKKTGTYHYKFIDKTIIFFLFPINSIHGVLSFLNFSNVNFFKFAFSHLCVFLQICLFQSMKKVLPGSKPCSLFKSLFKILFSSSK